MSTKYKNVCTIAGTIVLESSRTGKGRAYVRRDLLNRLEDALIEAGFDMKSARAKVDAAKKIGTQLSREKRDANELAKFPIGSWAKLYSWRPPVPLEVTKYDLGQIIRPDSTSPRKRKPDHVYVRWNIPGEPRSWVSVYDLEATK